MLKRLRTLYRRAALGVVVLVAAGCAAAGCSVPGAGHLRRAPSSLPAVMQWVPGDAMAFTVVRSTRDEAATQLDGVVGETSHGVDEWAGPIVGRVQYVFDVHGSDTSSRLVYAGVRDQRGAERALRAAGFARHGHVRSMTLWMRDAGAAGARDGGARMGAAVLDEDSLVAAADAAGLRAALRAAESYSVRDRVSMAEYVERARSRAPVAVMVRGDMLRNQVRRLVQDDPAELQLVTSLVNMKTLLALRDGWVGVAGGNAGTDVAHVVGEADWVPDLAPDVSLEPVSSQALDRMPATTMWAVAVHDPGQFAADLVHAVTRGGDQFATASEAATGTADVKLFDVFDRLDGDGALGWDPAGHILDIDVAARRASSTARRLESAAEVAGLNANVRHRGDRVLATIAARRVQVRAAYTPRTSRDALLRVAGPAPRRTVAWVSLQRMPCAGPLAGWVGFAPAVGRLTFSFGAAGRAGECPLGLVAPRS